MEVIIIIIGFILGLLASYLFWRYLLLINPRICISSFIAKGHSLINKKHIMYRIKIYNNSQRPIINIYYKICIGRLKTTRDGDSFSVIERVVKEQTINVLGPKKNIGDHWGLSPMHHLTFRSTKEIEKLLGNPKNVIHLQLICFDSKSGSAFATRKKYSSKDIRQGMFRYGLTFKLKSGDKRK